MQALAMQCGAAILTALLFWLTARVMPVLHAALSIGHAIMIQATLAALLTALLGLAPWWIVMALLFAPALLITVALHLPPLLFLAAFLFLLLLYWTTFRTQVPFYPSGRRVWQAVVGLLPTDRPARVLDIGSGLGGLVLHLATARADCIVSGIELAPLPWFISWARARLGGSAAQFIRGDYERLDFANYDIVFAYLSPAAMPALWQKAKQEMRSGALLLSYEFCIDGVAPDLTVLPHPHGPPLYGWRR